MAAKPRFDGEWVRLGEVCTVVSGSTPKSKNPEYWNGKIKWVTPAELSDSAHYIEDTVKHITENGFSSASLRMLPIGTVLLTSRAPIGKVAITRAEMCCNQGFKNLVCSDALSNEFLFRALKYHSAALQAMGRGATFKELSKKDVESFKIKLPSKEVQTNIVMELESIERPMAIMKQQLEKLDTLIKSRFVEMFGNLRLGYKYEIQKLGALLSVDPQNGLYKPQKFYVDKGGVPIVRVDAFQTGHIDDYGSLKRLECSESEIEVYGLCENDIVINRVNGSIERVGKIAWIHGLAEPTVFESNMMRFHVDEDKLDLSYITAFLNSDDIRQQIKSRARIANQCSINQGNVADFDIPLPPLALQQEFAGFVEQVDKSRFVARRSVGKYNDALAAIEGLITR